MSTEVLKQAAAQAALGYLEEGSIVGVGTGSTANHFIAGLARMKDRLAGAVASSEASAQRLRAAGVPVFDLNEVGSIPVYVDGADEISARLAMIKGGGGALTREKIVAAVARKFVCIADESKLVDRLGKFPLPLEIIPMAREHVIRSMARLGGKALPRLAFVTDNGNQILDVHGLSIGDPLDLERRINDIAGVVSNGLFALRPADLLLLATTRGVETRTV